MFSRVNTNVRKGEQMNSESPKLRVAVAAPLTQELVELFEREPRIELLHDPSLLPPMRFPADFHGDPAFERTPEQQERYEELLDSADAHFGIADGSSRALARAVEANPKLRWVHTMAAGGGAQVKKAGLTDEQLDRIIVTTSAGVHGRPLAEFALFGLLAGFKDLTGLSRDKENHDWPTDRRPLGMLAGSRVLVAGLGGIGREVVRLLDQLGATVIGYSRRSDDIIEGLSERIDPADVLSALADIDAVVLALPDTDVTRGSINTAFFAGLKPGSVLVNVGRGSVVDENALIAALKSGAVSFAALDVFAVEPLPADNELWSLPNVVVSPHTAALDPAEERRIVELFVSNATQLLDGRPLQNVMDRHDFY